MGDLQIRIDVDCGSVGCSLPEFWGIVTVNAENRPLSPSGADHVALALPKD